MNPIFRETDRSHPGEDPLGEATTAELAETTPTPIQTEAGLRQAAAETRPQTAETRPQQAETRQIRGGTRAREGERETEMEKGIGGRHVHATPLDTHRAKNWQFGLSRVTQ